MSPSRRTRRDWERWPQSDPHRRLLELLHRIREDEGLPTYAKIASGAHLAQSRISEFLAGKAMPSDANVERLVRAMGGGDDEVDNALRLLTKCLAASRSQAHRSRSNSRGMADDHSASLLRSIQDTDALYRDLDLNEFTGRTELIERIRHFIDVRRHGYVIIRAEAGIGKTALAAHLVTEDGFIYHFTGAVNGRSVAYAFRNLCAQLIRRYGGLESETGSDALPDDAGSFEGFWHVLTSALAARHEAEPIVIMIDGMDEFEFPSPTQTSLELPATLPDDVFVIITSRFGGEARLTSLRAPSEWLTIDVESTDNISDMCHYVDRVIDTGTGDAQLLARIAGADLSRLRHALVTRCAGVWIYLKYVIDEIRDGARTVDDIDRLPADLGGYYAQNIMMWRGDVQDASTTERWRLTTLPLLVTLAAIREPLPMQEIARLADVDRQSASAFLTVTARAFLNRDPVADTALYAIRHESFRDLLRSSEMLARSMPVLSPLADDLQDAIATVDARLTNALIPPGWPCNGFWNQCSPYANRHLAYHAAACGRLDALLADAGFLISVSAESILTSSASVQTEAGRLATRVLFLSLQDWEKTTTNERLGFVNMWATRLGAHELAASSAKLLNRRWRISASSLEWPAKRTLSERYPTALDIQRVDGRTMIACGYWDAGVGIFDADTGIETDYSASRSTNGWVSGIQIFRAGNHTVLVASWSGTLPGISLQAWDVATHQILWTATEGEDVLDFDTADVRGRAVLIYTHDETPGLAVHRVNGLAIRDLHTGEKLSDIQVGHWIEHIAVAAINERMIAAVPGAGIFELDSSFTLTKLLGGNESWIADGGPLAFDQSRDSPALAAAVANRVEFVNPLTWRTTSDPLIIGDDNTSIDDIWTGSISGHQVVFVGTKIEDFSREVQASLWDVDTHQKFDVSARDQSDDIVLAAYDDQAGSILAVGSHGGLQVWEPRMDATIKDTDSPSPVEHLSYALVEGRKFVVAGSGSFDLIGAVTVYEANTKKIFAPPLEWNGCSINTASLCSVGDRSVVIAGGYNGARVWDLHTRELLADLPNNDVGRIRAVEIVQFEGGHLAIVVNDKGRIFAFTISRGWSLAPFYEVSNESEEAVAAIGPRSICCPRVAVISDENDVLRMFDLVSGNRIGANMRGAAATHSIAICHVGGQWFVFSCGLGGEVRRSMPSSGSDSVLCVKEQDGQGPLWAAAAGHVAGRVALATGGQRGRLAVWDAMTGRAMERDLLGHRGGIQALIMDDVGRIVSGGSDGALTWWDLTQ